LSGSVQKELIYFLAVSTAITRSAHIAFSTWLPAAMAASNHASALVHSSSLFIACFHLLIRFSLFFFVID